MGREESRGSVPATSEDQDDRAFGDRLSGLLAVELIAGGIALVSPVTPTRTGSRWSPAELFVPDPGYLQKALAAFVAVNLLFILIGVVVFVIGRAVGGEGSPSS